MMSEDIIDKSYFSTGMSKCSLDDWQYEMRRDMQEIIPGIYLGPLAVCRDTAGLQKAGITHVVCLLDETEANLFHRTLEAVGQFQHYVLNVSDNIRQPLICHFPTTNAFIREARDQGGKVLICCNGGMSRSPCFVIAYIMETYDVDAKEAYQFVQSKRLCINPNDLFKSQLKEYEPIFRAAKTPDQGISRQKRNALMDGMDSQAPNKRQWQPSDPMI
ncbi:phosphatases II [Hesseltinella vesiculosa]|uniref:Phosphatases II n=1 Tax=Hesseltinella vesiculosa TaxID=101127 RepID=A0A1X2G724_9FUNG|nr:phosphatases II [Hesseltinella vesiculosa]